ncbi:unnamed protein product [Symbiodinium natans]|uniref:Uncharacterized protein n=1 Tax=Symbiodinium natans TaxID=878477 RepID=A0A812HFS5_9DINO|nr:unnamed protein product [Symbiodinium natans]
MAGKFWTTRRQRVFHYGCSFHQRIWLVSAGGTVQECCPARGKEAKQNCQCGGEALSFPGEEV